jgi:hypothetical protein
MGGTQSKGASATKSSRSGKSHSLTRKNRSAEKRGLTFAAEYPAAVLNRAKYGSNALLKGDELAQTAVALGRAAIPAGAVEHVEVLAGEANKGVTHVKKAKGSAGRRSVNAAAKAAVALVNVMIEKGEFAWCDKLPEAKREACLEKAREAAAVGAAGEVSAGGTIRVAIHISGLDQAAKAAKAFARRHS